MRALTEFQTAETDVEAPAAGPIWAKAKSLSFDGTATAEDALIAAVDNAIDHMAANESCVLGRFHPEGVHQMRVAVRRLRSRLSIYSDLIPEEQRRRANKELKWLIRRLGSARDWDVFVDEVLGPVEQGAGDAPGIARLSEAARKAQDRAYAMASKALTARRYEALKHDLRHWSKSRAWRDAGYPGVGWAVLLAPVRELASTVLTQRDGEVRSAGEHLATMTAEERHELRIKIKALRYAVEFFAVLYSDNAVKPYLARMKELQDHLGQMNDLVVAGTLMASLMAAADRRHRPEMATAAGIITGWHRRGVAANGGIDEAWERFASCEPFWTYDTGH